MFSSACAHPPRFVRRTPVLRLLYVPNLMPYFDHPRFSYELHRRWKGPQPVEGGSQFQRPGMDAALSIAFLTPDMAGYKPPAEYRRNMTIPGTVDDSHLLSEVEVSSRTALRARYTTYNYDPAYLLGERVEVLYTEHLMIPEIDGIYVIRLQAPKTRFNKVYPDYETFLKSLTLAEPPKKDD